MQLLFTCMNSEPPVVPFNAGQLSRFNAKV
nr:MAG TPA: hypothetical protein [Caudoviricetes sp.]